ncbi:MAG: hypothetical protein GC150_05665 [Rhizobiales bacterium]|nr:hypothetical protein [Hyphomicrobiales bacterium]
MRIDLLFGFLGSGKTTLASRILKEWGGKSKLALVVNEFGDVGVDGDILRGASIDMIELNSGCLCCTLKGSLILAIDELAAKGAEHIVVEATGVASPDEMLDSLVDEPILERTRFGPMTTVVDGSKFLKVRELLGDFYCAQIACADLLVVNKIDLVDTATLENVTRQLRELNPDAVIRYAERGNIDIDEIMQGPESRVAAEYFGNVLVDGYDCRDAHCDDPSHHHHDHDHDHDHDHHGHGHHAHRHAPGESFVIDMPGEIDRAALVALMGRMPERLWRAKGFVRNAGASHLLQYAMGNLEITPSEPRERHYLVFIGQDLDRGSIERELAALSSREAVS